MKIELCDEDIFHLKSLLADKDVMKIAFDKQDVWPFTVMDIIKIFEENKKAEAAQKPNSQSNIKALRDQTVTEITGLCRNRNCAELAADIALKNFQAFNLL